MYSKLIFYVLIYRCRNTPSETPLAALKMCRKAQWGAELCDRNRDQDLNPPSNPSALK